MEPVIEPDEDSQAYHDMLSDMESGECAVIQDDPGASYTAVFCGEVAHHGDWQACLDALNAAMDEQKFWPSLYYINDHGNVSLLNHKGEEVRSWV